MEVGEVSAKTSVGALGSTLSSNLAVYKDASHGVRSSGGQDGTRPALEQRAGTWTRSLASPPAPFACSYCTWKAVPTLRKNTAPSGCQDLGSAQPGRRLGCGKALGQGANGAAPGRGPGQIHFPFFSRKQAVCQHGATRRPSGAEARRGICGGRREPPRTAGLPGPCSTGKLRKNSSGACSRGELCPLALSCRVCAR